MDKHLNNNELKLQELLENKSFGELSDGERKFVLSQTTKDDYILNHLVMKIAPDVFDDEVVPVPMPLIIKESSKTVLFFQVPMYQTLMAVAATVIFMLLIFPINKINNVTSAPEYIVKTDTIEIEKEIIKYDTVYQTIEKPIYIEKEVIVENKSNCTEPIQEAPRLLNSNTNMSLPELTQNTITNKGTSLKDDNLSSLLVEF